MTFLSYVASCFTDPWVIGPLSVVSLVFGWTCLPYKEKEPKVARVFRQPVVRITLPRGWHRVPPPDLHGEALVARLGELAQAKAPKRVVH